LLNRSSTPQPTHTTVKNTSFINLNELIVREEKRAAAAAVEK